MAKQSALGLPKICPACKAISRSLASLLFYDEDRQGVVSNAHVGVIGACRRPHRLTGVETMLNGHAVDDNLIREAAATAARKRWTRRTICMPTPPIAAAWWRRSSSAACAAAAQQRSA